MACDKKRFLSSLTMKCIHSVIAIFIHFWLMLPPHTKNMVDNEDHLPHPTDLPHPPLPVVALLPTEIIVSLTMV